jgi:hypothetical protein
MDDFKEIERNELFDKTNADKVFVNSKYQVIIRCDEKGNLDGWLWLSIKRKDREVIRDWREFQEIKNLICGKEREGLELYPAESRLVDSSNQYHIFVMPKGEKFPFGYTQRLVVEGHNSGVSKQREFNENPDDTKPLDYVMKDVKNC